MKILSNITPNQDRLEVHPSYFFPRLEPTDFLLVAFDGFFGFALGLSALLTFFFGFIFQIGDPKTSFSKFLKYGENKKNHIFTIDNTNGF